MATAWASELAFAVELAQAAGGVIVDGYERVERVVRKSPRDVVTEVDYRSEALVAKRIAERFPHDAILAEESGRTAGKAGRPGGGAERVWVVDPLDGTVNYANGIPYFCVSVALVADGRPVVGVVVDPLRADAFLATADGPATLNSAPVHASRKGELADFVVSLTVIGPGGIARERRVARAIRIPRRMGSAALSLAYVASGRFDAFVQNGGLSVWDVAAAGLIAERAGARVTDLFGGPWWNAEAAAARLSVVAAPPQHHGELLRLLAEAGTSVQTRR